MKNKTYNYTALGMLFGIFSGAGIGVILAAVTANPIFYALAGAGAGIGLALGAGFDRYYSQNEK